ncbi:Flavin-dependent oxidoreductase, luciferase family (includes alkanesulfonate monooxygenase SsuD and methylene tetrahydromethanopterin reductase) [Enhydrobacter aerosaccus]|uniref:Flavin-dependent oxidoreductase, luciferase family (Includes alkanesulfonate monooxygenase SsuD and methylene tetrahydromethanopterin reductase) n=1 Tax=Enhydrobacter aerosaccus TaxID=225324 RepID=A0A1T4T136_9HYPH|nr:LLM class flavin-dependent oxidoreductase [Enhydrobacter aerosaccus]SKA34069.1 Flavin-dependent oxidoreductase, luciferase family (includes alkanesulfonate monooxygenase SsuD and methylene tetrahydromethanopterin reductase) [Enhydrobacter aerosaccus]
MEFGMFHEFQQPPGASAAEAFAQSFAQVEAAERLGLDAMWLAELHFAPERSVLASPLILAAAIAERTTRMKIGTAVQVLPLCHPLRLAEEVATVDQLSGGRLIFGVGRSGFAHTYATYGVEYGESRERFSETLTIVKRAFTEERFSHKGKYFAYDNVRLAPKPLQRPWPEIRIAAASPDTYEEVGSLGHPIFIAARTGNLSELAPLVKSYRAAWIKAGHPGRGAVYLRVPVYVANSDEAAREEPRESIMHLLHYIGDRLAASATATGARAIENRAERGQKMQSIDYEEVLRERMIVGTPERVTDRLQEVRDELGLDGILAELNPGSLIPHPRVMTALTLLCEEVMPRFK